jgi:hypothetical protein
MICYAMEISVAVKETLAGFEEAFPDERSCEAYLFRRRWPRGFVCRECRGVDCASRTGRAFTYQCSRCRRQTSITARTVMHRSKLLLTEWFSAAYLIAKHPDIISTGLFEALFGISPQSSRLLRRKFEGLLAAFGGRPLEGLVEIDHAEVQLRAADGSVDLSGKPSFATFVASRSY